MRRVFIWKGGEVLVDDFDGDLKFLCDLGEHIGSQLFWFGFYSKGELSYLGSVFQSSMTFFDIGAHRGEFTLFAAKRLCRGKVFAFEPNLFTFHELRKNIAVNGFKNVALFQQALGDRKARIPLFSSGKKFFDGSINEGLSTLYETRSCGVSLGMVDMVTLDDVVKEQNVKRVDVIKIDVEGAELSVLRGAHDTISSWKPLILLEVNKKTCEVAGYRHEELLQHLENYGYSFETILWDGKTKPIKPSQLMEFQNVICSPS